MRESALTKFIKSDVGTTAVGLLNKNLVLRPQVEERINELRARVHTVQAYTRLDHTRYSKPFDSKSRQRGSIFALRAHTHPMLSVVEDPEKRSIIVLRELGVHNLRMSIMKLLTDPAHGGMSKEDATAFIFDQLDGLLPGTEADLSSPVALEQFRSAQGATFDFDPSDLPNCLGTISLK